MHVSQHTLACAPIAIGVGLLTTPISGLVFLAGGVLIDTDHYMWYILTQRDLSLRRAWLFFQTKQNDGCYCLCALHTVEAMLVYAAIVCWCVGPVFWLAAGCLFHIALDVIQSVSERGLSDRKWSLIYSFFVSAQVPPPRMPH